MKEIAHLAFRNFFRNTRRSLISCISVAIAVAVVIFAHSYLKGMTGSIIDNVIRLVSGHVRITTREYERRERMLPLGENLPTTPALAFDAAEGEVTAVAHRIKFGVMLGEGAITLPALGYGIEPEKEAAILGLDRRITRGDYLKPDDRAVILGRGLADRLGLDIGDTLTVVTRTAYDSPAGMHLVVKGVYSTGLGGIDRSVFYMPLEAAQEMLDLENRATETIIILRDRSEARNLALAIRREYPELAVVPYLENPTLGFVAMADSTFMIMYFIIMLVACSTIATTMLMIVFERSREIGMVRALGMGSGSIIGMLLGEAALIGAAGGIVGSAVGAAFSYWLKHRGIDVSMLSSTTGSEMPFGPVIYLSPTPVIVFAAFCLGLFASVLVAYLPVRRAASLDPARSLRAI